MTSFSTTLLRFVQIAFANVVLRLGLCFLGGWAISKVFYPDHFWLAMLGGVLWGVAVAFTNIFLTEKVKKLDEARAADYETWKRGGFDPEEHDGNV